MSQLFMLFEHATGYALFKVAEFEDVSSFTFQVAKSVSDVNSFRNIVELVSYQPFTTGRDALENMNSITEGLMHSHLQQFLENNVPKSKKKRPVTLGVDDPRLGSVISEVLGISCSVTGVVPELFRGIRMHFHNLVKGIRDLTAAVKAELGLGHHFSRANIKFNVNKIDNMIIQSINIVDQLDKDINTFAMRIREWYSFHFPELIKVVSEIPLYVKCVRVIKDRKNMPEDIEEQLLNILMDSDKVQKIMELARSSMGMEISPLDMENVVLFAERISSLIVRRRELMEYLKSKMHCVAPNLSTLIGETVGARLIAHAGSLINLAKFPASTVQILGAEKALFRALKTRGNTPKYGLIYHSTFIGRAGKTNKGRISRYLANKCSVASRIDCFREIPTEVFGSKLRQQVEDRLKFYETGELPAKNIDVMAIALGEADVAAAVIAKQKRKADKKAKKRLSQQLDDITQTSFNTSVVEENHEMSEQPVNSEKKKKKRKRESMEECELNDISQNETEVVNEMEVNNSQNDEDAIAIAKQKRKAEKKERKRLSQQLNASEHSFNSFTQENGDADELLVNSKKKKKKKHSMENNGMNESFPEQEIESQCEAVVFNSSIDNDVDTSLIKQKKKKKKKHQGEVDA